MIDLISAACRAAAGETERSGAMGFQVKKLSNIQFYNLNFATFSFSL